MPESAGNHRLAYAHSRDGRPEQEWETLEAHALRVAEASAARAEAFGAGDLARILGLLHDLGKLKPGFQAKLEGVRNDTTHSGEGARLLWDRGLRPLAAAIAGHHGRLPDLDHLKARIASAEALALPDWCDLPKPVWPERIEKADPRNVSYRLQFLVRVLYGALCDADDRETAASLGHGVTDTNSRPVRRQWGRAGDCCYAAFTGATRETDTCLVRAAT